jgi:hypothetical protein
MTSLHRSYRAGSVRRVVALAASGVLLAGALLGCGSEEEPEAVATPSGPSTTGKAAAEAAATWLTGQLDDGVLVNEEFGTPDYGATVDAIYAFRVVGGHDEAADRMTAAVESNAAEYATPGKDVWAGNAGKLVALATDTGGDPSDIEGFDALGVLEERTDDTGRTSDKSEYGDFANSLGQAWAVRGLTAAGSSEATAARDFLLQQQCEAGFFRQDFSKPGADPTCDGGDGAASNDATALAVVVLHELAADDDELAAALDAAVGYLLEQQADDGSLEGSSQLPANANSTGLAGWAFQVAGEDEAAEAAAGWVRAHQVEVGCDGPLADASGAIAYDDAALSAGQGAGLTAKTSYQWRLATAQATPALLAASEGAEAAGCTGG